MSVEALNPVPTLAEQRGRGGVVGSRGRGTAAC